MEDAATDVQENKVVWADASKNWRHSAPVENDLETLEVELTKAYASALDVFSADFDVLPASYSIVHMAKFDKLLEEAIASHLVGRQYGWRHDMAKSVLTIAIKLPKSRTKSRYSVKASAYKTAVFAFPKGFPTSTPEQV